MWLPRNEVAGEVPILGPPVAAQQVKRVSLLGSIYREGSHFGWG
jgi:hypothetical protein